MPQTEEEKKTKIVAYCRSIGLTPEKFEHGTPEEFEQIAYLAELDEPTLPATPQEAHAS